MNISADQQKAIDQGQIVPVVLEGTECVIVRKDVFDRVQTVVSYDDSDWTEEETRALAAQMFEGLDNPEKIQ